MLLVSQPVAEMQTNTELMTEGENRQGEARSEGCKKTHRRIFSISTDKSLSYFKLKLQCAF